MILFIVWYGLTSQIKMSNSACHVLITVNRYCLATTSSLMIYKHAVYVYTSNIFVSFTVSYFKGTADYRNWKFNAVVIGLCSIKFIVLFDSVIWPCIFLPNQCYSQVFDLHLSGILFFLFLLTHTTCNIICWLNHAMKVWKLCLISFIHIMEHCNSSV